MINVLGDFFKNWAALLGYNVGEIFENRFGEVRTFYDCNESAQKYFGNGKSKEFKFHLHLSNLALF